MSDTRNLTFVWTRNIRLFHWINVISILLLVAIGVVILNSKAFGVTSDGKVLLKTLHVLVGYVFAINLVFRLILGFVGKGFEKFGEMLPFKKGYLDDLKAFKSGEVKAHKGHNPAGKLMVAALLLAMTIQMVTGLVIAGTDIYYPPFGQHFAESIAIDKSNIDAIKPYSKENVDPEAYQAMRDLRKPFMAFHYYTFYALLFLIPLHIIGVIVAERKEKTGLVSSMVSGYKAMPKEK